MTEQKPITDVESASEEPQSFHPMGCPECGSENIENHFAGQECLDCEWEDVASPSPPEGGWPRGSDMDRI